MANTISGLLVVVAGYPQPWGTKYRQLIDLYGPSSYSNVASSSGTGQVVNASDVGMGGFDDAGASFSGYSASGNYIVGITIPGANKNALGGPQASVSVQWFTTSTAFGAKSTEVTNATSLAAEVVRLAFVGI